MSQQHILNEAQRAAVREAIAAALTGVYYCGRVWSAWGVGTMHENDFTPADQVDEVLDGLTDAAMAAMAPPVADVQGAEKVTCGECHGSGGTSVHAAINHGEHGCTDCNGKGFNWEPVEPDPAATLAALDSDELTELWLEAGRNICASGRPLTQVDEVLEFAKLLLARSGAAGTEAAARIMNAARYRKLRAWMSSNVQEGWSEVEKLAAIAAYLSWDDMDKALDALPECNVGLCHTRPEPRILEPIPG